MKVHITTNGFCEMRNLDISRLIDYFRLNGCEIAERPEGADYNILVTCSYKKYRIDSALESIDRLGKYKGELIIAGCLPAIEPSKLNARFTGRQVVAKDIEKIDAAFPHFKIKFKEVPDSHIPHWGTGPKLGLSDIAARFLKKAAGQFSFSPRFFIKCARYLKRKVISGGKQPVLPAKPEEVYLRVGSGCLGNCSYCGIRLAIGRLKSKPLNICLREYEEMLSEGYRRFYLMGDDVGAYGQDINSSFDELLRVLSKPGRGMDIKWRIKQFHPIWAVKYKTQIVNYLCEKRIDYILCPIQSGSQRILQLMNRYSDCPEISKTLLEFKNARQGLFLHTHVIVGFPSETEDDFLATLDLIKRIRFNMVQLLPFYDGQETAASKFNNKIDKATIVKRIRYGKEDLEKAGVGVDVEQASLEAL